MGYNKEKTFAVARLREAARDCKVRKTLLDLKHTASRTKVDQLALACAARPAAYAAAKERAQKAYEDFLKAAGQRGRIRRFGKSINLQCRKHNAPSLVVSR